MKKLKFSLPDFTRVSWASDPARAEWEPRLGRIAQAWLEIQWRSVLHGVRSCAIVRLAPEEYLKCGKSWVESGLSCVPLRIELAGSFPYASRALPAEPGQPTQLCLGIGSQTKLATLKKAFDGNRDAVVGKLLGYPACCIQFFQQEWVKGQNVDTTWPMAESAQLPGAQNVLSVAGSWYNNILWRWIGVRCVCHLPCSFGCVESASLGARFTDLGVELGFRDEMNWLKEILSWPVEWSALHGIAEIKTPILKISTNTDATSVKYVVRWQGTDFPARGAAGLNFPFRAPVPKSRLAKAASQDLMIQPRPTRRNTNWQFEDNGFSSLKGMDRAHQPILEAAVSLLSGDRAAVLDLGCGNGMLLKKILKRIPRIIPCGLDRSAVKIMHARQLLPAFSECFAVGDMFLQNSIWEIDEPFGLVLIMAGRFREATSAKANWLREQLRHRARKVLIYAYNDFDEDFCTVAVRADFQVIKRYGERIALAE